MRDGIFFCVGEDCAQRRLQHRDAGVSDISVPVRSGYNFSKYIHLSFFLKKTGRHLRPPCQVSGTSTGALSRPAPISFPAPPALSFRDLAQAVLAACVGL